MPHSPVTWRDHLRCRFENTLSKGAIAIMGWLGTRLRRDRAPGRRRARGAADQRGSADPGQSVGVAEGAWHSLMHALDPGALAADQGWGLRADVSRHARRQAAARRGETAIGYRLRRMPMNASAATASQ